MRQHRMIQIEIDKSYMQLLLLIKSKNKNKIRRPIKRSHIESIPRCSLVQRCVRKTLVNLIDTIEFN